MTIVEINAFENWSTGNIMMNIAETARAKGHTVYTFSGMRKNTPKNKLPGHTRISGILSYYIHYTLGYLFGLNECLSIISTWRMLKRIRDIHPDLIHLHIIHGQYLNISLLFHYLKKAKIPIVWTFHDCWAFTGRCPHFQLYKCDKWKTGCNNCSYPSKNYPASLIDCSKRDWRKKRKLFTAVDNLTVVTPSEWLASLVRKSFFKEKKVCVINNGINLDFFKPQNGTLREEYNCEGKFILLGVASNWGKRKGLDVFIRLAQDLDKKEYQIVLVGTDREVDQSLPDSIISIHRTENQSELAKIYTDADLFVNPTREDTFPTVNIESLACGTPVLTFRTGGSPEIIDGTCGSVVDCDDIDALEREIRRICVEKPYSSESCLRRAKNYEKNKMFVEYVKLYEIVLSDTEN